jgi:hypothetical protein
MRHRLSPAHSPNPIDNRVRPIRYLREFSNYLTPQVGFFSADTWTMLAIYFRNMLLNWLVLLPLIAAVLMVPRFLFALAALVLKSPDARWPEAFLVLFMLVAMVVLILNLRRSITRGPGSEPVATASALPVPLYARQGAIQVAVVVPFVLAAAVASLRCYQRLIGAGEPPIGTVALIAGAAFLVYMAVIHVGGRFYRSYPGNGKAAWALTLATLGAAGAAAGLFWVLG